MLTHLWSRNLEQAQHNGSSLLHDIWGLIKEGLKTGGDSTAGVIRRLTQAGILGLMLAVGICTHTHTRARAHTHTHTHTHSGLCPGSCHRVPRTLAISKGIRIWAYICTLSIFCSNGLLHWLLKQSS